VVARIRSQSQNGREAEPTLTEVLSDIKRELTDLASQLMPALNEIVLEEAERLFQKERGYAANKVAKAGRVVHQAAHALHAVRLSGVADLIDDTADYIESTSEYIAERDLDAILQDAGDIINRNRALVLGALFVAGLAAARVLKSSAPDGAARDEDERQGDEDDRQHQHVSRFRNGALSRRRRDR